MIMEKLPILAVVPTPSVKVPTNLLLPTLPAIDTSSHVESQIDTFHQAPTESTAPSKIRASGLTVAELPDKKTLKKQLSRWNALKLGTALGTVSGLVLAGPATLLEKVFKTKDITTATFDATKDCYDALQEFADMAHGKGWLKSSLYQGITAQINQSIQGIEMAKNPEMLQKSLRLSENNRFLKGFQVGMKVLQSTPALSIFLGMGLGAAVGLMVVGEVKKRLIEITEADTKIKEGTFTPKKPSFLQRMGVEEKPVSDPQADLDHVINDTLNSKGAFMMGVKSVLVLKFLKATIGAIPSFLPFVFTPKGRQFLWSSMKPLLTPLALFKFATLPVIGGLLAMKLVPWMRERLQLDDNTSAGAGSQ
jgi:hypothetical protein